jgi:RimJ/RimL family protein N-acetyltransferase
LGYAIMGILIGDPSWRGRGVATEIIMASANWLFHNRNIKEIILGVHKLNAAAIRAYSKVGFAENSTKYLKSEDSESITMVWRLPNFDSLHN